MNKHLPDIGQTVTRRITLYRVCHISKIDVLCDFSRYLVAYHLHDTVVQVLLKNRITYPALIIAVCHVVVKRIFLMIDIRIIGRKRAVIIRRGFDLIRLERNIAYATRDNTAVIIRNAPPSSKIKPSYS